MRGSTDSSRTAEASLLGNYVQKLEVAKALQEENLSLKTDKELQMMLNTMVAAGEELPVNIKAKLVERAGYLHLQAKEYSKLLTALNPFESSAWDMSVPQLRAIGCEEQQLIATFQDMCFQVCLLPLIRKGKVGLKELSDFARLCMEKFQEVDVVDLSDKLSLCLSETMSSMKAILGIVDESFQLDYQARHVLNSQPSCKSESGFFFLKEQRGFSHKV